MYEAGDAAGVKVNTTARDGMKLVSDEAGTAGKGREVKAPLLGGVTTDGTVRVRQSKR